MDEIHRVEEASQEAFRKNKPNLGQQLFNRANIKRHELWEWQKKQKECKVEEQARKAWSRGRSNEAMTLENRAAIMKGRMK